MAPIEDAAALIARAFGSCPSGTYYSGGYCYRSSRWSSWGRWVFAAVCIVVFIIVLLMLGCLSARRRKRRGLSPMYGTGWMGNKPNYPPPQYSQNAGHGQGQYDANAGYYNQGGGVNPQPQYGNQGYYGQDNSIPLQQPNNTYYPRGGDNVYSPPPGPPPSHVK